MQKEITYIIGHKNPDTDSIVSALALSELKKKEGKKNIIPARAGDINQQTNFILNYFKVSPPRYVSNVYPRAVDIMTGDPFVARYNSPLAEVMKIIRDKNIRFIPVIDDDKRPIGILSTIDIAKNNINQIEAETSREIYTSPENIVKTLGAEIITDLPEDNEKVFSVYVGAMDESSFLKVMKDKETKNCIVIVGDREVIQKSSVNMGIGLLIVTGGLGVNDEVVNAAKSSGVTIIISPYDSATTALLVRMSVPAHKICTRDFESASPDDHLDDLKSRLSGISVRGIVVLNEEGIIIGVVTKSNLLKKSGKSLILVDHNEFSQAVDGADMVNIDEVVDHHRLGNFHTTHPIRFICEPVGSTSTIIAEMYKNREINIDKKIAGLLLAGIISDTIILKSPTTSRRDKDIVPWLEEKASLNHKKFGKEIFLATSSLKNRKAETVVNGDYKTFEAKGRKFGIGQVETIGFDEFHEVKEVLLKEVDNMKTKAGLKLSALLVTDIIVGTSLLLISAEKEILYNLEYPKVSDHVYELKNVLSRKKQVAPHLLSLFNEIY